VGSEPLFSVLMSGTSSPSNRYSALLPARVVSFPPPPFFPPDASNFLEFRFLPCQGAEWIPSLPLLSPTPSLLYPVSELHYFSGSFSLLQRISFGSIYCPARSTVLLRPGRASALAPLIFNFSPPLLWFCFSKFSLLSPPPCNAPARSVLFNTFIFYY